MGESGRDGRKWTRWGKVDEVGESGRDGGKWTLVQSFYLMHSPSNRASSRRPHAFARGLSVCKSQLELTRAKKSCDAAATIIVIAPKIGGAYSARCSPVKLKIGRPSPLKVGMMAILCA
jgi:hypothetical protein